MPPKSYPNVGPGGVLVPADQPVATMASSQPNQQAQQAQQPNLNSVFTPGGSGTTSQPQPGGAASQSSTPQMNQTGGMSFAPMFDPLAVQLFYHQAIAPMLTQLAGHLGDQNAQFAQMAQANMDKREMPDAYKAIFGQSIPRQAAAQNDVIHSLMASAMTAPALDQLMNNVNNQKAAMTRAYQQALANQYMMGGGGLNSLGLSPADLQGGATG